MSCLIFARLFWIIVYLTWPSKLTMRSLACPYRCSDFEFRCRQGTIVGNVKFFFRDYSGISCFPIFNPPTLSTLNSLPPTSRNFIFSFIDFMPSFTSFMLGKIVGFGVSSVYNLAGCLSDTGTEFCGILKLSYHQNFMILILYILDFENRKHTKFQFNWFISFQHINFLINFDTQISKCSMHIKF